MSAVLTAAAHPAALELYEALRDLDPARFKQEMAERLRARLVQAAASLERAALDSPETSELRVRLAELARTLRSGIPPSGTSDATEGWMELRAALTPRYEALAHSLRLHAVHVPSLRPTNYTRSLFHILSACAGLAVVALGPHWMKILAGAFFLSAVAMETSRRVSTRANAALMWLFGPVAHPHEAHRVNSASWYATALIVLAFAFPPEICAVAVAVLGFGDPAAALVGRRFGRVRLIHGRSLEGTGAFVVAGGLAGLAAFWVFAPMALYPRMLPVVAAAAVAGGIAELVSHRIDDNLSVPVAAAFGAWLML